MKALQTAFASHSRHWRDFQYVYPVISRRSKGLSIGVNLNPDTVCNFDCIYCQVDRTVEPKIRKVDLEVLESELRHLVEIREQLFDEPEFREIDSKYRRLNDLAFSGDGEPTASPLFYDAVQLAARIRREHAVLGAKIIVITDACFLTRPKVAAALELLDRNNGEIWAKLDAGTEAYFRKINVPSHSLQHVMDNILAAARARPLVIQSLFMRVRDEPPSVEEIDAYVGRLRWVLENGGRISHVQVYTVARRPAQPYVSKLPEADLTQIGDAVRSLGLATECYP